ncbi:plant UBX domain-containing protein 11 isoform X2 [Phragmites australis]|nr:plant UBX domain-containing protein 11 isoform X2 [Phragmites australis]
MLWNHEGYISSEDLKESIEKAWAALHLQETAATLLTASLASRSAESMNTASTTLPQGGSSTSGNPSASSSQSPGISGASEFSHSTDLVSQLPRSTTHEPIKINENEGSKSDSDPVDRTVELDSARTKVKCDLPDNSRSSNMASSENPKGKDSTPSPKRKNKMDGSCTAVASETTPSTATSRKVCSQLLVEQEKATTSSTPDEVASNSVKSDDIQLSVRMPSGNRLEIKLTKQDVLRKVKNIVDENKGSGISSYDLSMIYPKKVFTEQDMDAMLCELGIQNRQAMIVVPHRQPVQVSRRQSSSPSYNVDGNSDGGGYFGYLRTVLSYVNPLSYLTGNPTSSNPEQQANGGLQQQRPSSGQWNRPGTETASEHRTLPDNRSQQADGESSGNSLRRRSRPFGANVHTLGRDDHGPSDDKNVFWNGNSTEFGGDDRK